MSLSYRVSLPLLTLMVCLVFGCDRGSNDSPGTVVVVPEDANPSEMDQTSDAISAEAFSSSFDADPFAHMEAYAGVTVELIGRVRRVAVMEDGGGAVLRLEAFPDAPEYDVICKTTAPRPWEKALPGQTVRIRGVGLEFPVAPILESCSILDVRGSRPPIYALEAIVREFVGDFDMAIQLYGNRPLILEGEIASFETDAIGAQVTMKTDPDDPEVLVGLNLLADQRGQLTVGKPIRVLADFSSALSDAKQLFFTSGTLLD